MKARLENLTKKYPGFIKNIEEEYNSLHYHKLLETYIFSLSEHGNTYPGEDKLGRLSMWRAYGGATNVALIVNFKSIFNENESSLIISPVTYTNYESYEQMFKSRFENTIKAIDDIVAKIGTHDLAYRFSKLLYIESLILKHPGFCEEKEWRIIYSPTVNRSIFAREEVEDIRGIPQLVHKISLSLNPTLSESSDTSLSPILQKIIIGPTQHPWPLARAFQTELQAIGLKPIFDENIIVSNIPIRK